MSVRCRDLLWQLFQDHLDHRSNEIIIWLYFVLVWLICPRPPEKYRDCLPQNLEVECQRPVLYVAQVEPD